MLIPLRSLWETETIQPPVIPPSTGGGGGKIYRYPPLIVPVRIPAEVWFKPARAKFRVNNLTATGGARVTFLPVKGKFSLGKLDASGAANVQTESAKATFRTGKITAVGIENDEAIAAAILEL